MQRLQRIDQDAGDIAPPAQNAERVFGHLRQRVGVARRRRIADARLNIAPPAVIGAAKAHQMRPSGMIARQPNRLHHRFGAGHVEGNFVQPGDFAQPRDVVGDSRMIGAEDRPKIAHPFGAARDAVLVEVMSEKVDAVGPGQVIKDVAVKIGDRHAGRRRQEGSGREMLADEAAELERHPIGAGELKIGDAGRRLGRQRAGLRRSVPDRIATVA